MKPAEPVERRALAKRNSPHPSVTETQSSEGAESGLRRIREAARRHPQQTFNNLLHHITPHLLEKALHALKKGAASGVDGMTWSDYAANKTSRIEKLHKAIHQGSYKPQPTKRVWLPKHDGSQRPIGISALEDKIVQQCLVWVMESIYEEDFLGFSYGFRPGRNQHNALDALYMAITTRKVSWVLDTDIQGFFDNLDHDWVIKFIKHRISDNRVINIIKKLLKAGVEDERGWSKTTEGTPQGAVASPLLANIYLHYVLDLWVEHWRKRYARGEVYIVRYADDSVVCFQYEDDGRRFHRALEQRLRKFNLSLHESKTRLIRFGRFAEKDSQIKGKGKPATFDFLGFTHICGKRRSDGGFQLKRVTIAKRQRKKIKEIKTYLIRHRSKKTYMQGQWLKRVVQGYYNYHAIPLNRKALDGFRSAICRAWIRALRRRSHKARKLTWERMQSLIKSWIPSVKLTHPYPNQRFRVITQSRSPVR